MLALWLAAVGRGDTHALAIIYGQTGAQLFAVLRRILKRRDLAAEVLHDVFIKVWQQAASFDVRRGPAMAWLVRIARHAAADRLRRTRYDTPYNPSALDEPTSEEVDSAAAAFATAESRALYDCLDQLDPEPRDCLLLAYWDGFTPEELARRLDRPADTVRNWVRHSLLRLKQCLEG
jgi:RNA polymerase sigma-70 factor (ECF subfamily)